MLPRWATPAESWPSEQSWTRPEWCASGATWESQTSSRQGTDGPATAGDVPLDPLGIAGWLAQSVQVAGADDDAVCGGSAREMGENQLASRIARRLGYTWIYRIPNFKTNPNFTNY